jgi:acetolactate synthase-1/2/3 large subunit
MTASDLFVSQLVEEGVTHIFGVPGEENLDLLESIRVSGKITFVVCRHEQAAAFMAATFGRLTGKAGVCLSTLGPGATNLVTGMAHGQLCGFPMLAITGQKGLRENWQGAFQIVDVVDMVRPITKSTRIIPAPRKTVSIVHDAIHLAESERPGCTHIELPEDVAGEELPPMPVHARHPQQHPEPDAAFVAEARALLQRAKRPFIIAAGGGNRQGVAEALRRFADATGVPVVCTQMGKGLLSDEHACSLFATGIHKKDYVHCGLHRADLIITVGYDIVEHPPRVWNPEGDKSILHLAYTPARSDEFYNPACELTGDIACSLDLLADDFHVTDAFTAEIKRLRAFLVTHLHDHDTDDRFPLIPQRIVADVRSVMGKEDIVSLDNGIYKIWFARCYPCYAPLTMLVDNCLATMGAGLPVAMAAHMLHPEKRVLAVCGDGGFMMNSQEMETAVRLKMNLTVLLLNDNAYGFIRWKQHNMGLPEFAMGLGNPDFVKYAEAYGAKGYRVTAVSELKALLEKTFNEPGVKLIECPIDYSENARVFNEELEHLVCPI